MTRCERGCNVVAKSVLRTIAALNSCLFAELGSCDQTLRHDQCPSRQQAMSVLCSRLRQYQFLQRTYVTGLCTKQTKHTPV